MSKDIEKLLQQNNAQLLMQFAAMMEQKKAATPGGFSMYEGGTKEMPKKFKYGQGSVVKRIKLSYIDQDGIRQIKTTPYEEKAKEITSKYKCSIYEWYEVQWYDEYGKKHRSTAKTTKDAYAILSQNNKRTMKNTRKQQITFGDYMRDWYNTFRAADCGPERNTNNLLQISRIPKEIMNKPLAAVTAGELQKHIDSIKTPNPRATTQQLFTAVLKYAFNSGHIKANIGMLLKVEVQEVKTKEILPRELEDKFLSLFSLGYHRDYATGLIYTGCRIGEFMRLNENWETDIDYVNKKVRIRETKSLRQKDKRAGKHFVFREIPLHPKLEALKFPLQPIKAKTVNKNFNKVLDKLANEGIHIKITPHCMRHTFISRMNEDGIAKSVIKEIVGHKTDKMMNHYTHNTTELIDREFEKVRKSKTITAKKKK